MKVSALSVISGHVGAIYDVWIDRQGKFAFTTSADKFVVRWDLTTGEQDSFTIKLEYSGFRVGLNEIENKLLIGNSRGGLHVVDLLEKKEIRYLTQHQSAIFSISFNALTNEFYTGDADGFFCVWDASTMNLKLTYPLSCGKIRNIAIDEAGKHIALCGQNGKVVIFETDFYNEVSTFKAHETGVNCACFLGDELLTGGKNAMLSRWNWKTGELLKTIPAHNYAIYDLLVFPEKDLLVTASFDKTIKLWKLSTLEIIQRLERKDKGHKHVVNRLGKMDENHFVSVSDDKSMICWEIS